MSRPADIVFHGVRGSAPASGAEFAGFGGDTPSIEIAIGETRIFIDAGSGLKNVQATSDFPEDFDIVLSHYHYDHLIGLPFFEPVWRKTGRLRIFAPDFGHGSPRDILNRYFALPYCPVRLDDLKMRVEISPYVPGDCWEIESGAAVATSLVNHPGGCAAIRLAASDVSIAYASDAEIACERDAEMLAAFVRGVDLFIADAMNDDENAEHRKGWGHSSWRQMLEVSANAGAKATALFHHDPRRRDEVLAAIDAAVRAAQPRAFLARQGGSLRIESSAAAAATPDAEGGESASWRCSR